MAEYTCKGLIGFWGAIICLMLLAEPVLAKSDLQNASLGNVIANERASGIQSADLVRKADCTADRSEWEPKDYITIVASLSGALVALCAIFGNLWISRRSANQRANEEELAAIRVKLDTFFGPFLQLSKTNALLASELRSRQPDPADFRVLKSLLDKTVRKTLSDNDIAVVAEIVANDAALDAMIHEKSGLVDHAVQPYLWRASAHFRMMQLAYKGEIEAAYGETRFDRYVYPRALDTVVDQNVQQLSERATLLRTFPMREHAPMSSLKFDASLALPAWPT